MSSLLHAAANSMQLTNETSATSFFIPSPLL
jgi:hypothetical protein